MKHVYDSVAAGAVVCSVLMLTARVPDQAVSAEDLKGMLAILSPAPVSARPSCCVTGSSGVRVQGPVAVPAALSSPGGPMNEAPRPMARQGRPS